MRHWKLTATLVTGLALAACEVHPAPQSAPAPVPSPHTLPNRETQPQPVLTRFGDCGDDAPPCITYDDGTAGNGIYIVMPSHPPTLLTVCDVEDYPTNLPCVLKHQDPQDRWILLTPAS